MKKFLTITSLIITVFGFSQETKKDSIKTDTTDLAVNKVIKIDTLRVDSTLISGKHLAIIDHVEVSEFDKQWLESLRNSAVDSSLIILPQDTIGMVVIDSFSTDLLKERLALLNSTTPFHVEYNPSLEKIIKHYFKKIALKLWRI